MKRSIEIECPKGYKPVYNPKTGKVDIVPEDITDIIGSYEDAAEYLGYHNHKTSADDLFEMELILDALNQKHKFQLFDGQVWYPSVVFFDINYVPKDANVIGHFFYHGNRYALVGGYAASNGLYGISYLHKSIGASIMQPFIGFFACKSEKIAKYVSLKFGKKIFDICFARYLDEDDDFEWLD